MKMLYTLTLATIGFVIFAFPSTGLAQTTEPPTEKTIVEVASQAGSFETLLTAVKAAGLAETLASEGSYTVFAPTDRAFDALPDGTVESLLEPENREALRSILLYHVVPGRVTASQIVELDRAQTALGRTVEIEITDDGAVRVGDARVVETDVEASNGVIHVIDAVILPPEA